MLLRINHKNFIIHMIDHFTREEILGMNYILVSAGMKAKRRANNVWKSLDLYPADETAKEHITYQNIDLFRKNYFRDLEDSEDAIYTELLKPIIEEHSTRVLICKEKEDDMMDVLCEYLEKKYGLQAVDLNKLFTEGKTPSVKFDREKLKRKIVDINRRVTKQGEAEAERSSGGRFRLLKTWDKKKKMKKLKSLGIRCNNLSEDEMTRILMDEWVEE